MNNFRDPQSLQVYLELNWIWTGSQICCLSCCWHQKIFLVSISNNCLSHFCTSSLWGFLAAYMPHVCLFMTALSQWPECFCHWLILNPVSLLKLCCYVLVWITSCLSIAMFVLCFTASKSPCERQISKGSLSLGSSASLPPQTGNRDNLPMLNTKILYPSECNTTVHSSSPLEYGWQQSRLKPLYKTWIFSAGCPFAGSTWK